MNSESPKHITIRNDQIRRKVKKDLRNSKITKTKDLTLEGVQNG